MAEYEMTLQEYWRVLRHRWRLVACSILVVGACSLWFARQAEVTYQATVAVQYEQSALFSGVLLPVVWVAGDGSIETQAALVKSAPVLGEAHRRLIATSGPEMPITLESLAARLKTTRVPGTSIIEITATAGDARLARDLANITAEAYRDYNLTLRNARVREGRKFIENQLAQLEERVRRSEVDNWAFRSATRTARDATDPSVTVGLLTQWRSELERVRQQRAELELARGELDGHGTPRAAARVFVGSSNPALERYAQLLAERDQLALEVTDRHPRLTAITERVRDVNLTIRRELDAQVALLERREGVLNRQLAALSERNRDVELDLLRRQREAKVNDELLALLKTKHQEALIKEAEVIEEVSIIRPATQPGAPVGRRPFTTLLVGSMLGVVLGVVFAFVQETLDTSIGTIEDVEGYLQLPVVGIVPNIDVQVQASRLLGRPSALVTGVSDEVRADSLLVTAFDPQSAAAEAYRVLRTNLQVMMTDRRGKTVLLTSSALQEGKSTTAVNLAVALVMNGQRVLLVDANLRRPTVNDYFRVGAAQGLTDVLRGEVRWRDCLCPAGEALNRVRSLGDLAARAALGKLHVLTSGHVPSNPSELLSTPAMTTFLAEASEDYDVVLLDAPPVLPVADAAVVAAQVDGVLLVYQAGKVGRLHLKRARAHLEGARAKVWGVVLNDVRPEIDPLIYTYDAADADRRRTRGDRARSLIVAGRARPAKTPPGSEAPGPTHRRPGRWTPTSRRYGDFWHGVVVLAVSLVVLAGVVGWRLSAFSH